MISNYEFHGDEDLIDEDEEQCERDYKDYDDYWSDFESLCW